MAIFNTQSGKISHRGLVLTPPMTGKPENHKNPDYPKACEDYVVVWDPSTNQPASVVLDQYDYLWPSENTAEADASPELMGRWETWKNSRKTDVTARCEKAHSDYIANAQERAKRAVTQFFNVGDEVVVNWQVSTVMRVERRNFYCSLNQNAYRYSVHEGARRVKDPPGNGDWISYHRKLLAADAATGFAIGDPITLKDLPSMAGVIHRISLNRQAVYFLSGGREIVAPVWSARLLHKGAPKTEHHVYGFRVARFPAPLSEVRILRFEGGEWKAYDSKGEFLLCVPWETVHALTTPPIA